MRVEEFDAVVVGGGLSGLRGSVGIKFPMECGISQQNVLCA